MRKLKVKTQTESLNPVSVVVVSGCWVVTPFMFAISIRQVLQLPKVCTWRFVEGGHCTSDQIALMAFANHKWSSRRKQNIGRWISLLCLLSIIMTRWGILMSIWTNLAGGLVPIWAGAANNDNEPKWPLSAVLRSRASIVGSNHKLPP